MANTNEAQQFVEHYKNIELKRQVNTENRYFLIFFLFSFKELYNMYEKIK
jgi:hypothetical protein